MSQTVGLGGAVGNQSVNRLLRSSITRKTAGSHPASRTHIIQRHSESALEDQLQAAKLEEEQAPIQRRIDAGVPHAPGSLQRDAVELPKHERFRGPGGPAGPVPPGKVWRLDTVVPQPERNRMKQAVMNYVDGLFKGPDAPQKRATLRKRVIGIKFETDPQFHSPAQGQPGKVVINSTALEFYNEDWSPDLTAIRSTLIHELFHSSSINHEGKQLAQVADDDKGFQGQGNVVIAQTEEGGTQETVDEAATEWFGMQVYKTLYPKDSYKSAYFVQAPESKAKDNPEALSSVLNTGASRPYVATSKEQIPLLLKKLGITQTDLLEMYMHDHSKLANLLAQGNVRQELRSEWRQHEKQQLSEQFPLTTNAGLADLINDLIKEHRDALEECETREAQIKLLTKMLKTQHGVEAALTARTHNDQGKKLMRPLPATPGVEAALANLPKPGESWSTDDGSAPVLSSALVERAQRELKIQKLHPPEPLAFILVAKEDAAATHLDQYPKNRVFGKAPATPFPGDGNVKPYDKLVNYGGGGYEHDIHTAFLIADHAGSYHHYLHEVGHYKQDIEGYNEVTVPNTILLDYHNILTHENTAEHIRTLYSTEDKMQTIMHYPRKFDEIEKDVAGHKVMAEMFNTIEEEIARLKPTYQELYRRNLAYEYFKAQGGALKNWRSP